MRNVLLLLVLVALHGCDLRRVENVTTPYVATEYLPYAQPGSASIAGTLSGRAIAGQAMTCADMEIMLFPATAYTREGIRIARAGKLPSGRASPDNRTLLRSTAKSAKCDAKGHFAFDRLAAGNWLLIVELRLENDDSRTGAMIREIPVAVGEIVTVAFADADYTAR